MIKTYGPLWSALGWYLSVCVYDCEWVCSHEYEKLAIPFANIDMGVPIQSCYKVYCLLRSHFIRLKHTPLRAHAGLLLSLQAFSVFAGVGGTGRVASMMIVGNSSVSLSINHKHFIGNCWINSCAHDNYEGSPNPEQGFPFMPRLRSGQKSCWPFSI